MVLTFLTIKFTSLRLVIMNKIKEFRRIAICKELGLDYNLIEGDVYDGNVLFYKRYDPNILCDPNILIKFSKLEIRKVNGYFDCGNNNLTSLKGCPDIVDGIFSCNYNYLTSLEHGPKKVGDNYWCYDNKKILTKPTGCDIGGNFLE